MCDLGLISLSQFLQLCNKVWTKLLRTLLALTSYDIYGLDDFRGGFDLISSQIYAHEKDAYHLSLSES